ncbi:MAG: SDR family NAD(P)-dependent oxidoreductase, partial [Limisphaerales bacterium]
LRPVTNVKVSSDVVASEQVTLLRETLTEAGLEFEEINKDDQAGFDFAIPNAATASLEALYTEGTEAAVAAGIHPTNLLGAALFSTMVGMCFPGKRATFLNFDVSFAERLPFEELCRLQSRIAFKSATTSTISQALSFTGSDGRVLASGKIHARVNAPPSRMLSMQELAASELDLGLRGKVVLITGGSRGIGETTAKLFALHGAKVVINYLQSQTEAERIVCEISQHGGDAMAVQADVSDRTQVAAMVKKIRERFGVIHILVNNAVRDANPVPFLELTWNKLEADLNVVLKGAFNCCQEVLPSMVEQRFGKIINLATVFIETPPVNQSKYVISKSALVGLTRSIAVEFARHNIQCNLVVPSMVETDLSKNVPKIFAEKMKAETPMQRLATPVEVAKSILFLASSLSSFTTGQKVMVTGGNAPLL